jgi:hypothetical protein
MKGNVVPVPENNAFRGIGAETNLYSFWGWLE